MFFYSRDVTDESQDGKNILKESGGIDYSTYLGVSVSFCRIFQITQLSL